MKERIGVIVPDVIEGRIILLRGQKVILDSQIAELYGVETKVLKRAVSRNKERFPMVLHITLKTKLSCNITVSRKLAKARSIFVPGTLSR